MAKVQAADKQCPVELGLNILSGMETENTLASVKRHNPVQ